jgi:Ankyrin repeats (many copies)
MKMSSGAGAACGGLCGGMLVDDEEEDVNVHPNVMEKLVASTSKLDSITEKEDDEAEVEGENETAAGADSSLAMMMIHSKMGDEKKDDGAEEYYDDEDGVNAGGGLQQQPPPHPISDVAFAINPTERDFDRDPTNLYLSLMRKDWAMTEHFLAMDVSRGEAEIWIYRKERDVVRWKLLPLHAAIIFDAPADTVATLLDIYPAASAAKDDQGMLPLHLAVRMGSHVSIVAMLLEAFPGSIAHVDRKGRTPDALAAKQAPGPNQGAVLVALTRARKAAGIGGPPPPAAAAASPTAAAAAAAAGKSASSGNKSSVGPSSPASVGSAGSKAAVLIPAAATTPVVAVATPPPSSPARRTSSAVVEEREAPDGEGATERDVEVVAAVPAAASPQREEEEAQRKFSVEEELRARIHALEQTVKDKQVALDKALAQYKNTVKANEILTADIQLAKEATEQAAAAQAKSDASSKAVIHNLVSQVGDLRGTVQALELAQADLTAAAAALTERHSTDAAAWLVTQSELERGQAQLKAARDVSEGKLDETRALLEQASATIAALQNANGDLRSKLIETEKKLEEVTISEQELAWKHLAAVGATAGGGGGGAAPTPSTTTSRGVVGSTIGNDAASAAAANNNKELTEKIAQLEAERTELRDTVSKLSVKLYKVVGFLDEMVQEQEAIISNNNDGNGATGFGGALVGIDPSEMGLESASSKLYVSGMKEQIAGVIGSVIENMPLSADAAASNSSYRRQSGDLVDRVCETLKKEEHDDGGGEDSFEDEEILP